MIARLRSMLSGAPLILVATAVAGGSGYLATAVVAAAKSPDQYLVFGAFWSALYLVIAALSGIQQEVTRASSASASANVSAGPGPRAIAGRFALIAAAVVAVAVVGTSPLWTRAVAESSVIGFAVPIAFGAAGYVFVAVVCGLLYGHRLWLAIAGMIGLDGLLRLAGIGLALLAGGSFEMLAWAVVLPFPLTLAILWWTFRSRLVGSSTLDVGLGRLAWNSSRTVVASIATGLLVSGFPLLLTMTSGSADPGRLGSLLFAINIVRAPLVVVVMSLQSYFIVRFSARPRDAIRLFANGSAVVLAAALLLAVGAWFFAPWAFSLLWPAYEITPLVAAGLVLASGLLGVLCLSGPLALAESRHAIYTLGWVLAAVVTVIVLVLPLALIPRSLLAMLIAPLAAIIVHVVGVVGGRRRDSR